MNRCKNRKCGKIVTGKKVYCSDACRMAYKRQPEQVELSNPNIEPEQSQPEQAKPNTIETLSRVDLNMAIRAYPNDTWIDSPEHKELMSRLRSRSIEDLEADGYWIPAWKRVA